MRFLLALASLLLFSSCAGSLPPAEAPPFGDQERYEILSRGVVALVTEMGSIYCSGSFVETPSGATVVLTAQHCVDELEEGDSVRLAYRHEPTVPGHLWTLSASDAAQDLAVLTAPADETPDSYYLFAVGEQLSVADGVWALGHPLGTPWVMTKGTIVAPRWFDVSDGSLTVLFEGDIAPGNSGGPLVDDRGRLVGVVVAHYVRAPWLAIASHPENVKKLLEKL